MKLAIAAIALSILAPPAMAGFELVRPAVPVAASPAPEPTVSSIGRAMPLKLALPQIMQDRPVEIGSGVSPNTAITWDGRGRPASAVLDEALGAAGLVAIRANGKITIQKPGTGAATNAGPVSLAAPIASPASGLAQAAETFTAPEPPPMRPAAESWIIEPGQRLPDQLRRWGERAGYLVDDTGIASCECMISYGDVAEGDFIAALKKLMRPFSRQSPGVQAFVHPNKVIILKMTRDDFGG
jgi:hypothetical protein